MGEDYYIQIQRTIEFIEEHRSEHLSLAALAQVAGFSEFHFHRVFQSIVGDSVMDYVRKRRLAEAAYQIAHTNKRLIDIALDNGFQSHENFTRAFKKLFETTPAEYRKRGIRTPLYVKADVLQKKFNPKRKDVELRSKIPTKRRDFELRSKIPILGGIKMDYVIVQKPAFKLIGYELKTTSKDGKNLRDIPAFWNEYMREKKGAAIPNRVHAGSPVELGICTDFNMETGAFSYLIGMEAIHFDGVSKELICREFPEEKYAVFTTPKVTLDQFTPSIQRTWKAIFEEWFPHSGYEHAGSAEFELYDERCHADKNELVQMDIYVPIATRVAALE